MQRTAEFPLYTESLQFFDHGESMVRIAVRTITLSVFRTAATNRALARFLCERSAPSYFAGIVRFMCRYLEQINRAFLRLRSLHATDHHAPPSSSSTRATSTSRPAGPGPGFVALSGPREAEPVVPGFREVLNRREAGGASSALQTLQQVRNRLVDLLEEHVSQLHYMDDVLSLDIADLNAVMRAHFLEGLVRRYYLSPLFKRVLLLETPPVSERASQNPTPSHPSVLPVGVKQEALLKNLVLPKHNAAPIPNQNQLLVESSLSGSRSAPSSRSPSAHDISKVQALMPQQQPPPLPQSIQTNSSSYSEPEDALAFPAALPEQSVQMSAPLVLFLLAHLFFNVEHSATLSELLDVFFSPVGSTLLALLGREPIHLTPTSASDSACLPAAHPRSHSLSHVHSVSAGDATPTASDGRARQGSSVRSSISSVFSSGMSSAHMLLESVASSAASSTSAPAHRPSVSGSSADGEREREVLRTDSGNEMIELHEYRSTPNDAADQLLAAAAPQRRHSHSSEDTARSRSPSARDADPYCPYCNAASGALFDADAAANHSEYESNSNSNTNSNSNEYESEPDANITDEEKLIKRSQRDRRHRLVHQRLVFDLVLDHLVAPILIAEQEHTQSSSAAAQSEHTASASASASSAASASASVESSLPSAMLADVSSLADSGSGDQSALYVLCLLYALLTNARNRADFVRRLDTQYSRQALYSQLLHAELERLELGVGPGPGSRRPSYRVLLVLLCLRLIRCVCSSGSLLSST